MKSSATEGNMVIYIYNFKPECGMENLQPMLQVFHTRASKDNLTTLKFFVIKKKIIKIWCVHYPLSSYEWSNHTI